MKVYHTGPFVFGNGEVSQPVRDFSLKAVKAVLIET